MIDWATTPNMKPTPVPRTSSTSMYQSEGSSTGKGSRDCKRLGMSMSSSLK